ncbi:MAG: hypothetical protein ACLR23_20890 [Clostridia bacterium]
MSPGFASGYNAYASLLATIYVDDNQKVQFAMAQPEWKEYMTQLHQWYDEGIIDPDSVTLDDAGMRTKALNEKVGVSCTAISQLSNWVNDAKSSGLDADWVGAPYPVKNEGDIPCIIQGEDTISTYAAAVTTSCPDEKLELVLRWLDYGYTEEGYMYWNYGKEGESYTMVDGVPTYTELVTEDPEGINMALTKYVGTTGTGLAVQAENMVRQKNVPVCIEAVDTWTSKNQLSDHMYPSACSLSTERRVRRSAPSMPPSAPMRRRWRSSFRPGKNLSIILMHFSQNSTVWILIAIWRSSKSHISVSWSGKNSRVPAARRLPGFFI